tara:strand:+ start:1208 stop:2062 length:855 start_codon:yes stop_codon:yes gene_type:complete
LLIASWNVNSIRSRASQVVKFLASTNIDVLCLQETKVIDANFPSALFEEIGYFVHKNGQKSYNGVAFISKADIEVEEIKYDFEGELKNIVDPIILKKFDIQKRIISGLFNGIRIINLYVPNGSSLDSDKFKYKIEWLKMLDSYLLEQERREEFTCLLGDFNIALQNQDIYDPQKFVGNIMASYQERESLSNILKGRFIDSFRVFEKLSGFWSWWDYRNNAFELNKGWRIDHIYITNNLISNLKSSVIRKDQRENDKPSDHAPVVIELDFEESLVDDDDDDLLEL